MFCSSFLVFPDARDAVIVTANRGDGKSGGMVADW